MYFHMVTFSGYMHQEICGMKRKMCQGVCSKILGYYYNASWIHKSLKNGWDLHLKESGGIKCTMYAQHVNTKLC